MLDIDKTDLDKHLALTDLIVKEIFCDVRVPSSCTNLHAHGFTELMQFTRQICAMFGSTFVREIAFTHGKKQPLRWILFNRYTFINTDSGINAKF
jgi:hypothetical protein